MDRRDNRPPLLSDCLGIQSGLIDHRVERPQQQLAVIVQHDIGRLEVSVDDARLVPRFERFSDLLGNQLRLQLGALDLVQGEVDDLLGDILQFLLQLLDADARADGLLEQPFDPASDRAHRRADLAQQRRVGRQRRVGAVEHVQQPFGVFTRTVVERERDGVLFRSDLEQVTDDVRSDRDPMWIGSKIFFSSDRERRLWGWTLAVVGAIYSTLGLAGTLAGALSQDLPW